MNIATLDYDLIIANAKCSALFKEILDETEWRSDREKRATLLYVFTTAYMHALLERLAAERALDLIVPFTSVLWVRNGLDLTEEALRRYDAAFEEHVAQYNGRAGFKAVVKEELPVYLKLLEQQRPKTDDKGDGPPKDPGQYL